MMEDVPFIEKARPWEAQEPRCRLPERLPLRTPFSVQIDPSNLCNFKCQFCPTGHPELLREVGRSKGQLMPWALYEKLIDDLAAFPDPVKTLSLHKDGEPLMNPRLPEMVDLARRRGVARRIVLLTNASLLTREKAAALIDAGIDVVRVSVEHVRDEGYRKHTRTFGDYGAIVENVRIMREEIERRRPTVFLAAKLIDIGLAAEDLEIFARDFGPLCHEIGRTTAQGWSYSDLFDFTLGTNPQVALDGRTPLRPERVACPFPFYTMAINANGLVSPCPDDWTHLAAVGDASTQSLREIWEGVQLRAFRRMHLRGERGGNPACAKCHCIQGIPPDSDLDADRERLLPLFEDPA